MVNKYCLNACSPCVSLVIPFFDHIKHIFIFEHGRHKKNSPKSKFKRIMSGQSCALPEVLSATSGDLPAEQLLVDSFVEKTNGTIVARSYKVLPGLMQFAEGDLIVDDGDRLSVFQNQRGSISLRVP